MFTELYHESDPAVTAGGDVTAVSGFKEGDFRILGFLIRCDGNIHTAQMKYDGKYDDIDYRKT